MDGEGSVNPETLKELFNEVEDFEELDLKEPENAKKQLGFLEDIVNFEKEILSGKRKSLEGKNRLEQSVCSKDIQKQESVIHEGLTDSSEDEDNKYFEENKYNECGRNLKKLLKDKATEKDDFTKDSKTVDLWSKSKSSREQLKSELDGLSGKTSSNSLLRDPALGMNIINPLVSSAALKEKLKGRHSISVSNIKKFLEKEISNYNNWITGGAIVNTLARISQKGSQYCVWHVTDLSGDIKTVSVFLFGSAYKEYWKTSIGTVIGILNPTVMENNEKSEATLRVDDAQKILVIGCSKDGLCKSKKRNGERCTMVVNKSRCDYCVYHMQKEYNKACRRSDLQPPKIGRRLDNLRAKVLGKDQVFYGGKIFTGVTGQRSLSQMGKDGKRMQLLSQKSLSLSDRNKKRDEFLLKRLNQSPEKMPTKNKCTPILPKPEDKMIDLGFTVTKKERIAARANALKYIREHGPLNKIIGTERNKRTPEQISALKRKLEVEEKEEIKKVKKANNTPENPLKEKYLKNGVTDEFLKLMNSENRNKDILKMAESEEREKYFEKLEMREKIENKMSTTFKVECKAVRCLKCNYKALSASELCKKEKHPLKVVNAVKRFWKCGNCSARVVCLELVPLHSCKNCGSPNWEKTSMMPERKDSNITKVPLSLRGDEETLLGTATKQANLNLLVPE